MFGVVDHSLADQLRANRTHARDLEAQDLRNSSGRSLDRGYFGHGPKIPALAPSKTIEPDPEESSSSRQRTFGLASGPAEKSNGRLGSPIPGLLGPLL